MTQALTPQVEAAPDALLISIRSRFVRSIIEGTKTFELRRKIPSQAVGREVLMYSSGDDKAIMACAKVSEVITGRPEFIWLQCAGHLGVTRQEFDDYFLGTETAHALRFVDVVPSPRPVSLTELRTDHGLEPPQSWRYLRAGKHARLLAEVGDGSTCKDQPD